MEFRSPSRPYSSSGSSSGSGGRGGSSNRYYYTTHTDYIGTTTLTAAASEYREMEKAQIRKEIIAAEYESTVRRWVIEDEVRRELAFAREDLMQPVMQSPVQLFSQPSAVERRGLIDRSELPFQRRYVMPFQRMNWEMETPQPSMVPVPLKKQPVVFLPKPQKPTYANTTEANKNPYLLGPQMVAKEWICALCQVNATSEDSLNDHLRGKKHKAKEEEQQRSNEELRLNKSTDESHDNVIHIKQKAGGTKKQVALNKKRNTKAMKKQRTPFWCKHCKVGCYSETVMASHWRGKNHRARVQRLKGESEDFSSTTSSV